MLARCLSASIVGLEARPVVVEVDLAPGLPGLQLVGLPDTAIQESRERVRAALRNSGFRGPLVRVVVNLAPADLRKEGPAFDLPIALGLLVSSGQLDAPLLKDLWCAGELGLDGSLRPCRGILAVARLAAAAGARALVVPVANAAEASLVPDLKLLAATSLREVVQTLRGTQPWPCLDVANAITATADDSFDTRDGVIGQTVAQQALALAAAGGHHLLMVGPPGCGKTLLARQLPRLLPPLSQGEALEITQLHSIAGSLPQPASLVQRRPFRSPHHSCSPAALLGGGANPRPGELSLAHGGVLFLDELAEFPRSLLDQLRQPIEEGCLWLSRAKVKCAFPCRVTLVAATNPCPCGWFGEPGGQCRCRETERQRYWNRLSGPMLDRLDLQLRLHRLPPEQLRRSVETPTPEQEPTPLLCPERIQQARLRMVRRNPSGCLNSALSAAALGRSGSLSAPALERWERIVEHRQLSARSGLRLLRVARTLADLDDREHVLNTDLSEALCFRSFDTPPTDGVNTQED